jgi:hypothetical protein
MTTVTPAYGRDYKSKKAALADWNAGKDFIINDISNRWDGKPVNKQGAEEAGLSIMIRYDKLRKITNV